MAGLDRQQLVPAAQPVKAQRGTVRRRHPRELELVAIPELLLCRHDRLELIPVQPAQPPQRLVHLGLLVAKLLGVLEILPGAAATHAEVLTAGGDAAGARLQQLDRAGLGMPALDLGHPRPHPVSGERTGHEHDQRTVAGDAAAAVGKAVHGQLDLFVSCNFGRHPV